MNQGNSVESSLAKLSKKYEQIRQDEASTTVTYIGWAESGVATSAAKWTIMKVESASATAPAGETTFLWATSFEYGKNIWDNRATLTYTS